MRAATYIDGFRYRLSKKHRAPMRFDHLLDHDLLRLTDEVVGDDAAPVAPKQRRKRKPSLGKVLEQAAKAGLEVARYEVDPDGKITVFTGAPIPTATNGTPSNEKEAAAIHPRLR
jgi:hypothetical protein